MSVLFEGPNSEFKPNSGPWQLSQHLGTLTSMPEVNYRDWTITSIMSSPWLY